MPNCFTLTKKGEAAPSRLSDVDNELCKYFGVVPDEVRYYMTWYDIIGFKLAMGKSFKEIKDGFVKEINDETNQYRDDYRRLLEIAEWLDANYTPDTWAEIGRR